MNKFTELISNNGNETLNRRASAIAQNAEIAQQDILNSLKKQHGSKDWNPDTWAAELQETKQKLYFLEIQIKLAQETFDEYFTEPKKK